MMKLKYKCKSEFYTIILDNVYHFIGPRSYLTLVVLSRSPSGLSSFLFHSLLLFHVISFIISFLLPFSHYFHFLLLSLYLFSSFFSHFPIILFDILTQMNTKLFSFRHSSIDTNKLVKA